MNLIEASALGIVQGITEFLPISSTAHLRVVPALLGWEDPGAAFTAVVQLGTLLAVLVYFAGDMRTMARAALAGLIGGKPLASQEARLAWFIIIGTFPIGLCGLAFKKHIEGEWRSLYVISASLILLGIVLWWAERSATFRREVGQIGWLDSQLIGVAQAVALIPGASRSGTTMTAAMLLGLTREVGGALLLPARDSGDRRGRALRVAGPPEARRGRGGAPRPGGGHADLGRERVSGD